MVYDWAHVMTSKGRLPVLAATMIASMIAAKPGASAQVFRAEVRTVPVYVTVRDQSGRLVTDLDQAAFRVLDNGRPVTLSYFSAAPQPLTAVVLVDVSSSMEDKLDRAKASLRALVHALQPGDRLRIGTFSDEIALSPYLTGNPAILAHVIDEEIWSHGSTALWSALDAAEESLAEEQGRREILVLSDGVDAPSRELKTDAGAVQRRLISDEQMLVYAVGYAGGDFGFTLSPAIKKLAEDTGGGHYLAKTGTDLTADFAAIAEELRHQYVMGIAPAADGHAHRIEVDIPGRPLSVKARGGYGGGLSKEVAASPGTHRHD